jgi:hypothetical protein
MIKKITRAVIRTYSDSGQHRAVVSFVDAHGHYQKTEGKPNGLHMLQLMRRAEREGVRVEREVW